MSGHVMGAVLCGGNSQRFGRPKAVAELPDGRLMGHVAITALRSAGVDPVVAIGGSHSRELGVPTVPDRWPGQGPFAGVASALLYATQSHVLVMPCDLPLVTGAHIAALLDLTDSDTAVVAEVDGVAQPSIGIWPTAWARDLVSDIRSGKRRLRDLLEIGPYRTSSIPFDALRDADTPAELLTLVDDYD